jgi:hypothetical protein
LASLLLESVYSCRGFNVADVLGRYVAWWTREGFDTGLVADGVFKLVAQGVDPKRAVKDLHDHSGEQAAACNPLHRNVVLSSVLFIDDATLETWLRTETRLTHLYPLAADASIAAGRLCRGLARNEEFDRAASRASAGLAEEVIAALTLWEMSPTDRSGYAPSVLRMEAASQSVMTILIDPVACVARPSVKRCPTILVPGWRAHHAVVA